MQTAKSVSSSIAGKRILLTGGTTGIGRATLARLAQAGARVLTFGRSEVPLREALANAGLGPESGMIADVADPEALERVFAAVDQRLGGVDVLIANAGLGAQPIHLMADADWRYVVETNLVGYLATTRAALDRMLPSKTGHIVLVSSISAEIKAAGESVYAATKSGVNGFGLTLRKEVSDLGVRVTVIEPGSVGSDMQECTAEEQCEAIARGEMLWAEEIAEGILFAISRSRLCDVSLLRMEPIRQKTA